jgi:hypothetical protein
VEVSIVLYYLSTNSWRRMREWKYSSTILNSAVNGGEWLASSVRRFTPGTCCVGGWLSPRAGLDVTKKRQIFLWPSRESTPIHWSSDSKLYRCTDWAIAAPSNNSTLQNKTHLLFNTV